MAFFLVSYIARGLRVGQSEGDRVHRIVVDKLLGGCDVLCIQETFLAQQDLERLNSTDKDYHGAGESTTDLNTKHVKGRIPGGVAVLWHRKCDNMVRVLRLGVDWAIGLEIHHSDCKFVILNVYTPYECARNEDEYINRLATILTFIQDIDCTCIFIVGDMNADIPDDKSLFAKHLKQFCVENGLRLSSQDLLPKESYTYVSDAWHTTSWLDHCICTADAHALIEKMQIRYDLATSDHMPFTLKCNLDDIPKLIPVEVSAKSEKLDWSNLTSEDIYAYHQRTHMYLGQTVIPKDAILCRDINCMNQEHCFQLCSLYNEIVDALIKSGRPMSKCRKGTHSGKPGWNRYVDKAHAEARRAFKAWIESGKHRSGPFFENKKHANARFKYALRYIKRNENRLRSESLACKLQNNT